MYIHAQRCQHPVAIFRTKHNCSAMMQPMIKNQAPGLDFVSENTMAQQVSELNDSQLPQHCQRSKWTTKFPKGGAPPPQTSLLTYYSKFSKSWRNIILLQCIEWLCLLCPWRGGPSLITEGKSEGSIASPSPKSNGVFDIQNDSPKYCFSFFTLAIPQVIPFRKPSGFPTHLSTFTRQAPSPKILPTWVV